MALEISEHDGLALAKSELFQGGKDESLLLNECRRLFGVSRAARSIVGYIERQLILQLAEYVETDIHSSSIEPGTQIFVFDDRVDLSIKPKEHLLRGVPRCVLIQEQTLCKSQDAPLV